MQLIIFEKVKNHILIKLRLFIYKLIRNAEIFFINIMY